MKKINWKSNKTIAVILILVIILLALLITGIVLAVKHSRAESLPAAVPGTTAESLTTEPAETETATGSGATTAATTAVSATAAGAPAAANNGSSDKSSKPAGGSGGTNSKPSGSNTKPSGGSGGSGSNTSGGSGAKPVTTTNPAKKEFAMTKQEIIDYATDYIVNTYHCKYCDLFGKDVPGTGYIPPSVFTRDDTAEYMKAMLRGCADATYGPNGWYKVYVEMEDEDTMRVYLFYA